MNFIATLFSNSADLPPAMQSQAADLCTQLNDCIFPDYADCLANELFANSILKVCLGSRFISENWLRRPEVIKDLLESGDLFSATRRADYAVALQNLAINSEVELSKQLRLFRRREMLRIAWRDQAGWSDLDETLRDLSLLAENCISTALQFIYQQACQRWGTPSLADGTHFNMVVLGMGKLGAWELNFSSDIDLIFAFAEEGTLIEKKEISYGEFFTRISRSLLKALDEITVDGFVFRTDIRLRPFGDSGPMIMTFTGMENYYLTQAREWERYAMIKARQVAGDFNSGKQLAALIKPFVYRRYLDYGAFEELRLLKFQITQELKRKDRLENIKLGPGGIREVEFIGQAFQLIRGGQEPRLQQREIQAVLTVLEELQLLTSADVAILSCAYRFLRRVENHIQEYEDKQCHELPSEPLRQQILAYSLDFANCTEFKQHLDSIRAQVHAIFEQIFSLSEPDSKQQMAQLLWASKADDELALELISGFGYSQPESILNAIVCFKDSYAVKRMTSKGVGVIQRLLPKLLEGLVVVSNHEETLKRILDLFEAVAGRNVYLSLLAENPQALTQLIKLSAASPWICEHLAQFPILFDELMFERSLYEPLQKSALEQELQKELASIEIADSELLMTKLRQFKHLNVLRVAAADIMGVIPVMIVSDYLTWIAEVILDQVLHRTWLMLCETYGYPPGTDKLPKFFAIIAFGKLGGVELGYASDLDLVFLYNYPDDNALTNGLKAISSGVFYLRLANKIRHFLDTKMLSGVLYEVDLRLRPNGDSGLLVAHIDYYEDYLRNNAWTWEHQALVRARFVCGDSQLQSIYEAIRRRVLAIPRDYQELKTQVRDMRGKMRETLLTKQIGVFDLKQSPGGIADIEFIVQFGVLAETSNYPALANNTGSVRLLEALQDHGFINAADASLLKLAYCHYRDYGHHRILQGQRATADVAEFAELSCQVQAIWQHFMD